MPITGVYFIPSHPNSSTALPALTERLRAAFPDEELIPTGRWNLEQKLMRDTPGLVASPNSPSKPSYMQFLQLTHYPKHGFVYTSEPPEKTLQHPASAHPAHAPSAPGAVPSNASAPAAAPITVSGSQASTSTAAPDAQPMVMATLPTSSFGTLFHHFTYACQPFWCHKLTVAVPAGIIYDLGDFRVRLGDVRQTFPTGRVRGTIVEIEWRGPSVIETALAPKEGSEDADSGIDVDFSAVEEADVDAEYAATAVLIREFWARFSVDGAREAILVPGIGKEVKDQLRRSWGGVVVDEDPDPNAGADLARQYMEVLRFNR
ncbi:Mediator complex subunit Med20 [Penicillium chermesinum]|nr:Mediator complex subunit Med20 [Penicillium chermesinum]